MLKDDKGDAAHFVKKGVASPCCDPYRIAGLEVDPRGEFAPCPIFARWIHEI